MSYLLSTRRRPTGVERRRACRRAHARSTVRTSTAARTCARTSRTPRRAASTLRRGVPAPRIRLRIADCANEAHLEFSVESAEHRENSLHKIDTLLGALARASATRSPPRRSRVRAARECGPIRTRGGPMSYLKRFRSAPLAAVGADPRLGQVPNSAGGYAWAVDDWDAAAPLPRPRLGGRQLLRVGADAHAREREAVERCLAADGPRAVAEIVRVSRGGPCAEERPGALRAGAGCRPRRTRRRGRRRSTRCRRWPAPARTSSSSRRSSRASAAGAARCGGRSAAGTRPGRRTRSPTRR